MDITQVTAGSVAVLHLVGGQTLVGRVKEKDGVSITLSQPIELMMMLHPEQKVPVIALVPAFSMQGKLPMLEEVSLHLSHILTPREVPAQLEKDYLTSVSGIDLSGRVPGGAANGGRFRTS